MDDGDAPGDGRHRPGRPPLPRRVRGQGGGDQRGAGSGHDQGMMASRWAVTTATVGAGPDSPPKTLVEQPPGRGARRGGHERDVASESVRATAEVCPARPSVWPPDHIRRHARRQDEPSGCSPMACPARSSGKIGSSVTPTSHRPSRTMARRSLESSGAARSTSPARVDLAVPADEHGQGIGGQGGEAGHGEGAGLEPGDGADGGPAVSMSRRTSRAGPTRASPAAVSRTRRPTRSKRMVPSSVSSSGRRSRGRVGWSR